MFLNPSVESGSTAEVSLREDVTHRKYHGLASAEVHEDGCDSYCSAVVFSMDTLRGRLLQRQYFCLDLSVALTGDRVGSDSSTVLLASVKNQDGSAAVYLWIHWSEPPSMFSLL